MTGLTKRDYDAMQPITRAEFESHSHQWGFPGAGILSLFVIALALFTIAFVAYSQGQISGRHECFRTLNGYDY
jgi:hypothetical protein